MFRVIEGLTNNMDISSLVIIVMFLMMLLIIILLIALLKMTNNKVPDECNDYVRLYSELKNELTEIYKGIGKMEVLASGVDDLKRLLSNVKTRGIIGENQVDVGMMNLFICLLILSFLEIYIINLLMR